MIYRFIIYIDVYYIYPQWCSIVGATVTVHQFFCILHKDFSFLVLSDICKSIFYVFLYSDVYGVPAVQ